MWKFILQSFFKIQLDLEKKRYAFMIRNENDTNPENILVTFLTIQVDKYFRSILKWPKKKV